MKVKIIYLFILSILGTFAVAQNPRVFVLTDIENEPDDAMSFVRFLTYSNHFDCPYGTGAGCASLSKVNKMIDRHEIDLDEDESNCGSGSCASKKKQVYIYYGPDQMSKVISIDTPTRERQ